MISPRCPARGPSLSRSSRRRRSWRRRGGSSSGHRLWTLGTGTWSAGLKRFITLQSVFVVSSEFLLLFSSAEEEKRTHLFFPKLIDSQDGFPLQVWIHSVRFRNGTRLSSTSWGAVYSNPDNQDDHTHFSVGWNYNKNNSPVTNSKDTRSSGQLSVLSWDMTMDKAETRAR